MNKVPALGRFSNPLQLKPMNTKNDAKHPLVDLIFDLLRLIFSYIKLPQDQHNLLLTCRRFSKLCLNKEIFGPQIFSFPSLKNAIVIHGSLETVKNLTAKNSTTDQRVDPSAQDNQALLLASENGHLEIVKELLKKN